MHKIGYKLKVFIFFFNFDLAKGGTGASAPLALPGCALEFNDYVALLLLNFEGHIVRKTYADISFQPVSILASQRRFGCMHNPTRQSFMSRRVRIEV